MYQRHDHGLISSLFPKKAALKGHYPSLKKYPFLLPAAWISRIFSYLTGNQQVDPKKSIKIGKKRVDLLREYGIIER